MDTRAWGRVVSAALLMLAAGTPAERAGAAPPFDPGCLPGPSNATHGLDVGPDGTLYALGHCAGQDLKLAVSTNGGASWDPPVLVATGVTYASLDAGPASGSVTVIHAQFSTVVERHSTDFGRTFSAPMDILSGGIAPDMGFDVLCVGAQRHVMVAAPSRGRVLLRRSLDAGATWEPEVGVGIPMIYCDLERDARTGRFDLVADNPELRRSTSTDGGRTFSSAALLEGTCCAHYSDWALAGGRLYATGGDETRLLDVAWRWMATEAAPLEASVGLPSTVARSRSTAADEAGDLFTVGEVSGRIELVRWRASSPTPDPPIVVASAGRFPHVSTCGAGTAWVAYVDAATTIQVVPFCQEGPCCTPGPAVVPLLTLLRNGDIGSLVPVAVPPVSSVLAAGDGSGLPGSTTLDRSAPAERFPDFAPGALAGEIGRGGALVFYELEEPDGGARVLRLATSASGTDLIVTF